MEKVSKQQSLHHYIWGEACDGWSLLNTETLSIKQERMPAETSEQLHYHKEAQQFFFILKGTATFEINGESVEVNEQEGIHIQNGIEHRIMNNTKNDLEFILSSQPSTKNDRINL
jgi:mannose-6-phosphate isomerase-like protein (cupin superfamily)